MGARILYADNDQDMLETRAEGLTRAGYEVVKSLSPEGALRLLEERQVDLVVTDLRLVDDNDSWDRTGLMVYRKAEEKGVPAILCTGSVSYLPSDVCVVGKQNGLKALVAKVQEILGV